MSRLFYGWTVVAAAFVVAVLSSPATKGVSVDGGVVPDLMATAVDAPLLGPPWGDRRAATRAAATTLALFAQIGLVSQLFTVLALTLGEAGAGWVMGLATACAIVGRTAVGRVLPPGAARRAVGRCPACWPGACCSGLASATSPRCRH